MSFKDLIKARWDTILTEDNRVRLKFPATKLGNNLLKASGHRRLVALFTVGAGLYFFKADLDTIKASSIQTSSDVHQCREELNKVSPMLETMKYDIQTLNQKVSGKCVTTVSNIAALEEAGLVRKRSG
ncbi:hypothetical protein XANCAGTX0491_000043 [Xanthoria calcicola]